ncbi:snoRNA-binding rRNA-processing protein utp10 [Coemansia sp. RSA 552]|nr:snoRNA-binding rRNA-processing protein utp10 [Coemansia sp. RSA 552]
MASSLAGQLYRMRTVDRVLSTERAQKTRASFLFDGKQAADIDTQTVYEIGRSGLEELRQINGQFARYAATLFSEAVKDMDRVLLTRAENAKLDKSIEQFLFQLAPHFLTRPAGKTLEWLVRRFRIHEFNTRQILAALLPYHGTKAFLTLVTIMTIETQDMDLFGFLVTQRKARRVLDSATLMAQCQRDRALVSFICKAVFKAIDAGLDYPGLHSFYAMLVSQYVSQLQAVGDAEVHFVLPFVLDGLAQRSSDAQVAAYMVVGALAARVMLGAAAVDEIMCAVAQSPADVRAMALCLAQLAQTQGAVGTMSLRLVGQLAAHAGFAKALAALASEYDVSALIRALVGAAAHYAVTDEQATALLSALAAELPHMYAALLCESIVKECVAQEVDDGGCAAAALDLIGLRFEQKLEDAIGAAAEHAQAQADIEAREAAHRRLYALKMRQGSGAGASRLVPVRATATTLFLGLEHADAGVRLVAAKALHDLLTAAEPEVRLDDAEATSLICARLEHEDSTSVLQVILPLARYASTDAARLVSALAALVGRIDATADLGVEIVTALLAAGSDADDAAVAAAAFPFVLELAPTQALTRALTGHKDKKSAGWLSALAPISKKASAGTFNAEAAKRMAATLATQWEQLGDAWRTQLARTDNLAARTAAVAIGAQAAAKLADAKDVRGAEVAETVVRAALDIAAAHGKGNAAEEAAADGSAPWSDLLEELATDANWKRACVRVAVASAAAALGALTSGAELGPRGWFEPASQRDAVRRTFTAIVSQGGSLAGVAGSLSARLLKSCVSSDEWPQFLAALWLSDDTTPAARVRSLEVFGTLASARSTDMQTGVPAVIAMLGDSHAHVRTAAARCLKALRSAYEGMSEQSISLYDEFYGTVAGESRLEYLPLQTASRFVSALAAQASALAADPWTVRGELALLATRGVTSAGAAGRRKLNSQAREATVAFLLSHVAAADGAAPQLQIRLLDVLQSVQSPLIQARLLPLVQAHAARPEFPQPGSTDDALLRALFRTCFGPATADSVDDQVTTAFLGYAAGTRKADPARWTAADRMQAYMQQLAFEQLAAGFAAHLPSAQVTDCLLDAVLRGSAYSSVSGAVTLRQLFASIPLDAGATADTIEEQIAAGARPEPTASLLEHILCAEALATAPQLVLPLCSLLATLVTDAATARPAEYAVQLALTLLTRIFDSANATQTRIAEGAVRIDAMVQAVRASSSPQTHNQALLLLAAVAVQHPDPVLHHVMAIFTFMGANMLRQDDEYSFHVIRQALERIVPPLAMTERAAPVLRVFVDSLTHIPRHRRMALFATLVRTLGADSHAAAVTSLLLEKIVARAPREADDVLSFTLSLANELPATQQVRCCDALLRELLLLPADADSDDAGMTPVAGLFIDVANMTAAQHRAYRLVALDFTLKLLSGRHLAVRLDGAEDADAELADAATTLLELIAHLSSQHEQLVSAGRLTAPTAERAWSQTTQLAYAVLDAVNARMQPPTFVATVTRLLVQSDLKVRRKAMVLVNTRLTDFTVRDAADTEIDSVLEMLPPIAALAATKDSGKTRHELLACKHTALLCVATAARKFAALRPSLFTDIAASVASAHALGSSTPSVASAALVALSVLCDQLGARLIPTLPSYLPLVLKHLHAVCPRLDSASDDELTLAASALSAAQAIIENMGAFLAPSLSPLFACLFCPSMRSAADANGESEGPAALRERVRSKGSEVLVSLAKSIPPRQLVPAQLGFYSKETSKQGPDAIVAFVDFVGRTAAALQPNHLLQFYKPLFKFFLGVFDIARCPQVPLAVAERIEQATLDAFLRLVVKLSENLFKPLFLAFVDWATAATPSPAVVGWATGSDNDDRSEREQNAAETRLRVFYRVLNVLFARLKSILVPYYASVIDTTVGQLERFGIALESVEAQEEAERGEKPVASQLWSAVVESIHLSTLHDAAGEVWTEDTCRRVFRPLANQLGNIKARAHQTEEQAYTAHVARVRQFLAPAASHLAAAAGNDAMWKLLNQAVMLKSRSDYPAVREGVLLVLQALYGRLGEEFLILLPETIPYLAELLEDDDSRVERATHETIRIIESYLGESLQSYLR